MRVDDAAALQFPHKFCDERRKEGTKKARKAGRKEGWGAYCVCGGEGRRIDDDVLSGLQDFEPEIEGNQATVEVTSPCLAAASVSCATS